MAFTISPFLDQITGLMAFAVYTPQLYFLGLGSDCIMLVLQSNYSC